MTLSHLPDPADLPPRFVLLDRILALGKEEIRAARRFSAAARCPRNCAFPAGQPADFGHGAVGDVPSRIQSGPTGGKRLPERKNTLSSRFPAPLWQGLEALAQLAALHQRWRREFGQQAFLLSVQRLTAGTTAASSAFPVAVPASPAAAARVFSEAGNAPQRLLPDDPWPDGDCLLDARLLVSTEGAAQYDTSLRSPSGQPLLHALLHIGVRPFPDSARADAARRRYLELLPCLRNFPVPS